MDACVYKYIENEKEIAKYKISMLERREGSPARKRIIEIEKEFIQIPFETINFSSIEEVTSAIDLYRQSRRSFYLKYKIHTPKEYSEVYFKKINFLKKLGSDLISHRVQEINLVQDFDFYTEYVKYLSQKNKSSAEEENLLLKKKNLKTLLSEEPSSLAKKRARLQALFYSMGQVILEFVNVNQPKDNSDFYLSNNKIDSFVADLEKYVYRYYNQALDELPDQLAGTMGENFYFKKIHKLDNLFDKYNKGHSPVQLIGGEKILFDAPQITKLFFNQKKLIISNYKRDYDRQTKNKVLGILLPVERLGNEKMNLMYLDIYYSKINISELFLDIISNIKVVHQNKVVYYKAVLMKPLWALLNYASENKDYHFFLSRVLGEELDDISKFNDKDFILKINSKTLNKLEIDMNSCVLIPRTRSEEEAFWGLNILISKKIFEIKNEYKNIV